MHIYTCTTTAIIRGTSCTYFQKLRPQNMQDAMCFAMQFLFGFGWQHCTARLQIECATCLTSGLAIIMPILLRTAGSRWNRTQTHNSTILYLRSEFMKGSKFTEVITQINNYCNISLGFGMICTNLYWINNRIHISPNFIQIYLLQCQRNVAILYLSYHAVDLVPFANTHLTSSWFLSAGKTMTVLEIVHPKSQCKNRDLYD